MDKFCNSFLDLKSASLCLFLPQSSRIVSIIIFFILFYFIAVLFFFHKQSLVTTLGVLELTLCVGWTQIHRDAHVLLPPKCWEEGMQYHTQPLIYVRLFYGCSLCGWESKWLNSAVLLKFGGCHAFLFDKWHVQFSLTVVIFLFIFSEY